MAATAPAHYIRSIHTSFTAAHPRNSSWANAAAPRYAPLAAPHSPSTQKDKDMLAFHQQQQQQQSQQFTQYQTGHHHQLQYNHPPSISTHNSHTYTHHLYAASSAAVGGAPFPAAAAASASAQAQGGMGQERGYAQGGLRKGPAVVGGAPTSGRRRSVSIRMPPSYTHQRGRSSPAYKFDPFADDEAPAVAAPLSVTTPLTGSSQANRGASTADIEVVSQKHQHQQQQYQHAAPYTIHIPAAQPTEIQKYTPPPSPRPAARTTVLRSLTPINGPLPGTAPTMTAAKGVQGRQSAQPTPNLSKIVAGILLNRVHAVGKPMRRRVMPHLEGEKGYRKSCLSSVVSVEA